MNSVIRGPIAATLLVLSCLGGAALAAAAEVTAPGKAAPAANDGASLAGTVVGPDGRSVPNADLSIWVFERDKGAHKIGSAQSNGSGAFAFAGIAHGRCVLIADAKGLTPASVPLAIAGHNAPLKVALQSGRTVHGKVVDKSGKPIAGAKVSWGAGLENPDDPFSSIGFTSDAPDVTTDADGRFAWRGVPRLDLRLKIASSGYTNKSMSVPTDSPDNEIQIVLQPLLRIHGVATDFMTGQPITQFRILPGYPVGNEGYHWQSQSARTFANKDGSYAFDSNDMSQAEGPREIRIEADGYALFESRSFNPDEGSVTCNVSLTRADWTTGKVFLPDGKPFPQAGIELDPVVSNGQMVTSLTYTDSWFKDFTTDSSGNFRLPPQKGDFILSVVMPEGFATVSSDEFNKTHRIALQSWARLEGVYLRWNKPAAGQKLGLVAGTGYLRFQADCIADEHGRFAFPTVPPESVAIGIASKDGRHQNGGELRKLDLKPGETKSVLIAFFGRRLTGKLALGPGMKALTDLSKGTYLCIESASPPESPPADLNTFGKILEWHRQSDEAARLMSSMEVLVQSDGTFSVDTVLPGKYTVRGTLSGKSDANGETRGIGEIDPIPIEVTESASDATIDLGRLVFHPMGGSQQPTDPTASSPAARENRPLQPSQVQTGMNPQLPGAPLAPVPVPRYQLRFGQEITYESKASATSGGSVNRQTERAVYRVVGENPDGSWELIANRAYSNGNATEVELTQFRLWPDGKQKIEASGPDFESNPLVEDFPQLPQDESAESAGWRESVGNGAEIVYHRSATGLDPAAFEFEGKGQRAASAVEPLVLEISYSFRSALGLPAHMAFRASEGTDHYEGATELLGVVQMPGGLAERYLRECGAFFLAEKEFSKAMPTGDFSLSAAIPAGDILVKARNQATLPELRQVLDHQIADLASGLLSEDEEKKEEAADRAAVLDKPAPDWHLDDLEGAAHSLSDYRGKVVVLDFWYRGCGWCIKAMPQVKQLAADFANRPVAILGMNTDADPADAKFVVKDLGLNYPILRAAAEPSPYHVRGFPTLFIVDRKGVVREMEVGYSPSLHDNVAAIIAKLLAEN